MRELTGEKSFSPEGVLESSTKLPLGLVKVTLSVRRSLIRERRPGDGFSGARTRMIEPPVISGTGDVGAVKNPLPAACSVCDERDPQITLFYTAGLVVRLHAGCEALWQQERHT